VNIHVKVHLYSDELILVGKPIVRAAQLIFTHIDVGVVPVVGLTKLEEVSLVIHLVQANNVLSVDGLVSAELEVSVFRLLHYSVFIIGLMVNFLMIEVGVKQDILA
jgi:hypothetical protein